VRSIAACTRACARSASARPQLRGRYLEAQPAAPDAGAVAHDLDQLAADAAPDELHGVAGDWSARLSRHGAERLVARPDLRRALADEAAQACGVGLRPELLDERPPAHLEVAEEAARVVEVLLPAALLPRLQVGDERLRLGTGLGEARRLALELRAPRVELGAALLEAGDRARQVLALAGDDLLRRLERPCGDAVAARDRQREALTHRVVVECEARRARPRVHLERRDVERGARERETPSPAGSAT
jgi:hypothetical protein